ncbi:histone H2A deubiquitinase MYSM1-like, partial [Clarias magur]
MADEVDVVDIEGDECDADDGSPVKNSGGSTRWAQEEKDLFEKGLAQFGRRWTKIAKLIGTRTVLQVKSYARQYFKNKAKAEGHAEVSSTKPQSALLHALPSGSSPPSVPPQTAALANAVRIERLSDDEDVDITDDLSDDTNQPENQLDFRDEPQDQRCENQTAFSTGEPEREVEMSVTPAEVVTMGNSSCCQTVTEPEPGHHRESWCTKAQCQLDEEEEGVEAEKNPLEDTDDQDEEEDLKPPEQEVTLDTSTITEEEKQAIPEFFEGRLSKTPERYLKIRNYILDQWEKSKPKYLNKTSVRPGLKNCGDVNCIGRIHTYLELIGAINFNCEQAIYNRPRPVDRSRLKESRDSLEAYQLAQRLQSMRTRKRRVRDAFGNWCDARDLEGQTYEHLSAEELALRREEMRKRQPKPSKLPKRGSFDPFQLIQCKAFGEERPEPFRVIVCAEALVVMDVHAHVSMGEVIGLLGGSYNHEDKVLRICTAEPCNSLSTGMQCEMDPVSQTQASEMLGLKGHSIVGWYHSHPAFDPNPSLRDIDTQAKYQNYFSRGGAPFIGMIVSPYNPSNSSPMSQNTCLLVQEEAGSAGTQKLPYKFEYKVSSEPPDVSEVMRRAEWVVFKYRQSYGSVPMERLYRRDSSLTCLEKMLTSLRKILAEIPETESEMLLVQIEALFVTHFIDKGKKEQASGSSANFHEEFKHTFSTSELMDSSEVLYYEDLEERSVNKASSSDKGFNASCSDNEVIVVCVHGLSGPGKEFHTSAGLHAAPPLVLWFLIKPLQKVTAIILGRSIRRWWKALPPNKKQVIREWTWQRRWRLTGLGTGLLLFISLFFLTYMEESPVTGRSRLLFFSKESFIKLTEQASEMFVEEYGNSFIPESDPRHLVVKQLVQHLVDKNRDIEGMNDLPWTVHVVEQPILNAYVVPNGMIFIFTGMLEAVEDIHQLAFVLGHEMAHALLGHAAEQATLSHVLDVLSMLLLTMIWAICPLDSLSLLGQWIQGKLIEILFQRPYSRSLETEADEVGLQLVAKACVDVRASPVFWQKMELNNQLTEEPTVPEWFSTHPSHQSRVTHLDRLIPE